MPAAWTVLMARVTVSPSHFTVIPRERLFSLIQPHSALRLTSRSHQVIRDVYYTLSLSLSPVGEVSSGSTSLIITPLGCQQSLFLCLSLNAPRSITNCGGRYTSEKRWRRTERRRRLTHFHSPTRSEASRTPVSLTHRPEV